MEGKWRNSNNVERDSSMVSQLMNIKLVQALEEQKEEEHRYHKLKKELWRVVPWDSIPGWEFRCVLRAEMCHLWVEGKIVTQKKIDHLSSIYGGVKVLDTFRDVKISDGMLGENPPC